MRNAITALALATCALSAQAHHIWIEQDAQGAKLYFGEFGGNLREASPGLLDKFVKPTAQLISPRGDSAREPALTPNGFALGPRAASGESLIAEEAGYPASERKEGDKTIRSIYVPAARLVTGLAALPPKLTLDLVPTGKTGKDGAEFQAFYKSQPLPKAKVEVVSASGWSQTHQTGDDGKLTVQMPWRSTYVLELSHRDNTGGERAGGDKWDRGSFVTSLTVMQPRGLPALPTPAAAPPNKSN